MNILKMPRIGLGGRWNTGTGRAARRRAKRGSVGVFAAMATPFLLLLGSMSVDQSYVFYRYQMLQRTAQSAAMAAQTSLNTYYTTSSMTGINSSVQTIVSANMPAAQYGNVVPTTASNTTSNVKVGSWDNASKTFSATTTNPNAVQVTALNTVSNGNPVATFFRSMIGQPNVDLSATAVASYGNGLSGAGGFNTIILNDLSGSFSSEISAQRAVDIAILNCVSAGSNGNAKVGLTGFGGHSQTLYPLALATGANVAAMTTYINGTLNRCGSSGMPACSGSNSASGLHSAIAQLQAAGVANASSNIILITDGVPNANPITYTAADGTSTTPIMTPAGWAGCTSSCTDANLYTAAQAQSLYAKSLGINISTVYYSGSTGSSAAIATYSGQLASLVTGNGISLVAPTSASITTAFATFCRSMGAAAKKVQ